MMAAKRKRVDPLAEIEGFRSHQAIADLGAALAYASAQMAWLKKDPVLADEFRAWHAGEDSLRVRLRDSVYEAAIADEVLATVFGTATFSSTDFAVTTQRTTSSGSGRCARRLFAVRPIPCAPRL